jgi:hypothetical protein
MKLELKVNNFGWLVLSPVLKTKVAMFRSHDDAISFAVQRWGKDDSWEVLYCDARHGLIP